MKIVHKSDEFHIQLFFDYFTKNPAKIFAYELDHPHVFGCEMVYCMTSRIGRQWPCWLHKDSVLPSPAIFRVIKNIKPPWRGNSADGRLGHSLLPITPHSPLSTCPAADYPELHQEKGIVISALAGARNRVTVCLQTVFLHVIDMLSRVWVGL